MSHLYSHASLKESGEAWTPICLQHLSGSKKPLNNLLHVYMRYFTANLGIVMVCTNPTTLVTPSKIDAKVKADEIYSQLERMTLSNGVPLTDTINRSTI